MAAVSLLNAETKIKVSSTLDKSVGKKNLTDGSAETCWTSQQGLPQFIQLSFQASVRPTRLSLTFQGGFVGTRCAIDVLPSDTKDWAHLTYVYPEDVNRRQSFDLPQTMAQTIQGLKLTFEESSDFFGRITVYDLGLEGQIE